MRIRRYSFLVVISLLLFLPDAASAQETGDRLARLRDVTSNSEMILLWTEDMEQGTSDEHMNLRMYDLDLAESDLSLRLAQKPIQTDSIVAGNRRVAVAAGNFLGGEFKHFVGAWTGQDDSITIVVPDVDAETLSWTDAERLSIPGPISTSQYAKLRLATGDFLGTDMHDEFVVAYESEDGTINLHVYEFSSGSLTPSALGTIADEAALTGSTSGWDIVTGDFDGDGFHEILLTWITDAGTSNWSVQAKVYDIDSEGNIIPMASTEVDPGPPFSFTSAVLSAASGDFDSDPSLEVAVAFAFSTSDISNPDTYLYVLDFDSDLTTILTNDSMRAARNEQNDSTIDPLDVASGDLNGNSRDEIVLTRVGVFSVDDNLMPVFETGFGDEVPDDIRHSDDFLDVRDMDADGLAEIVTVGSVVNLEPNGEQYLTMRVSTADTSLNSISTLVASRQNEVPVTNGFNRRHYAMALGDFDADRKWMGMPVKYTGRGIFRPTVVLNTPPVHYDVLDGTVYDLSDCFPDQSCGFSATYTQVAANELTVSFETHEDWGVSQELEVDVEIKLKMKETYGEKFSLKETSSEKTTITTGRVAAGDDWIYTRVYDIDFYEYPVYDGTNPTPIGFFVVSIPGPVRPLWVEGKDDQILGNQFRPDHEVGNILSYRKENTDDLSSPIVEFQEQTVGSTGSSSTSVLLSSFTENNAETSVDASIEVGAEIGLSADIYGIEIGETLKTEGKYSVGEVTTQTVKVESSLEMKSDFGSLDPQFGTSGTYQITPYAYWTQYGAIAIDYKVSLPTGTGSFWDQWYGGKTDPGFSMPWRYEISKGNPLPLNDVSYEMRTRDIVLSNSNPEPGDTVRVGARVRNMALADLMTPIKVEFYYGDPSAGGELIAETEVDAIESQSSENVFVEWVTPFSLSVQDRVYVVLDSDDRITDEVHTNNNVGWAPVKALGLVTDVEPVGEIIQTVSLHTNYPNPFSSLTTIAYELPGPADVTLAVYDLLGREVRQLASGNVPTGRHEILFDGTGLTSGVYFVRLQAGDSAVTKRMVLVR
ncbi:MAG: T9SS type A sorting domain-containing protein [Rhodothermales bacterium]|nr:T9SS type A sorting domain-containing protein [Rhodothermales bacterium]